MSRLLGPVCLLLSFGLSVGWALESRPSRRTTLPNVIIIMADDLGYGDLGAYGQTKVKTPHLDQLAAEGMRFTQAYAGGPSALPSRAALLTGLHSGHARVRSEVAVPLEEADVTLAEVLRSAGYHTAAVGFWGLGWEGTTGHPRRQGFDEFFGFLDPVHSQSYYPDFMWRNEYPFPVVRNQNGQRGDYAPRWLERTATNFVKIYEDQAFFLYFTPTLVHANRARGTNGLEVPSLGRYAGEPWPASEKAKAAMITELDDLVGRVVADLRKRRLADDTLILFTSANGPHRDAGVDPAFLGSAGGLRGAKNDLYEGGIRVPLIAWWPGHIKPGTTNELPVALWDVLPTLAEITGTPIPKGLDGISFAPTLLGAKQERTHDALYWESHQRGYEKAGRMGNWKAVKLTPDLPVELYDLKVDPAETRNVAAGNPQVAKRFEEYFTKTPAAWENAPDAALKAAGRPGNPPPTNQYALPAHTNRPPTPALNRQP